MIILISGASHSGKTAYAQKLMDAYQYPYVSIDHLKMGLIRSGQTSLTPLDDDRLTDYLWPILREMIKTAIENIQNLILEGCYIPCNWKEDFSQEYLEHIRYLCLVMSQDYIREHFDDIVRYANVIEQRLDDSGLTKEELMEQNAWFLEQCIAHDCRYVLIDRSYGDLPSLETI